METNRKDDMRTHPNRVTRPGWLMHYADCVEKPYLPVGACGHLTSCRWSLTAISARCAYIALAPWTCEMFTRLGRFATATEPISFGSMAGCPPVVPSPVNGSEETGLARELVAGSLQHRPKDQASAEQKDGLPPTLGVQFRELVPSIPP
jgi:hypothetical protein